MTQDIPWRKRQEIPDAQIRDAADQYEAARKILASEPPGAGVVLPLINTAAVAIELYLKCLSAELIHTPDKDFPDVSIVTAAPTRWGHQLTTLLEELSDELKQELEAAYRAEFPSDASWTFREVLKVCEGAFAAEPGPRQRAPASS